MHVVLPGAGSGLAHVREAVEVMCRGGFAPPMSGGSESSVAAVRNYFYGAQCGGPESSTAGYYMDGAPQAHGELLTASAHGSVTRESLSADQFTAMFSHADPHTGEKLRATRGEAVPFMEKGLNVDKSLAVAADYNDRVGQALNAAMSRAATAWTEYAQQNFTTLIGGRGKQQFKQAEQIRAAVFAHEASRSGEAHAHLHVLFSTDVYAEGKYRGLHTLGIGKNHSAALNSLAEAVIYGDPQLRRTLAEEGYHFDPATGEVAELYAKTSEGNTFVEALSTRNAQIQRNKALLEANWRAASPAARRKMSAEADRRAGRIRGDDVDPLEPGAALRQAWDTMAWRGTAKLKYIDDELTPRPAKEAIHSGVEAKQNRRRALEALGFSAPDTPAELDQGYWLQEKELADQAIAALEQNRSAWSVNDIRAATTAQMVKAGVMADRDQITAHVEAAVKLAVKGCTSTVDPRKVAKPSNVPAHIRHWTSKRVITTEDRNRQFFAERAEPGTDADSQAVAAQIEKNHAGLNEDQREAVEALTGDHRLVVVEGAAGSGKSTMIKAAHEARGKHRALMMLTPTRTAAEVLKEDKLKADTVHKFLYNHGVRWDDTGHYQRLSPGQIDPQSGRTYEGVSKDHRLAAGTMIGIDEAGMLSQDDLDMLAGVLKEDYPEAQIALIGDRAQLPAVGRGGVLRMAVDQAKPRHVDLEKVHRFKTSTGSTDVEAAELSQKMRQRSRLEEVYEHKRQRGEIIECASADEAYGRMAAETAQKIIQGADTTRVVATNEARAKANKQIHEELLQAGYLRESDRDLYDRDQQRIPVGTRIATRQNDQSLGVANRQQFTVIEVTKDDQLKVIGDDQRQRTLPADYVAEHVETAWAVTAYGAQGVTVDDAAVLAEDSIDGGGLYVGATRGRYANTIYIVPGQDETGAEKFARLMHSDRSDDGLQPAAEAAEAELEHLAPIIEEPAPEPESGTAPEVADPELNRYLDDLEIAIDSTGRAVEQFRVCEEYQQRKEAFVQEHGITLQDARNAVSQAESEAQRSLQQHYEQVRSESKDRIYTEALGRAGEHMSDLQKREADARSTWLFGKAKKQDATTQLREQMVKEWAVAVPHADSRFDNEHADADEEWVKLAAGKHALDTVEQAPEVIRAREGDSVEVRKAQQRVEQAKARVGQLAPLWKEQVGEQPQQPKLRDPYTGKTVTLEMAQSRLEKLNEEFYFYADTTNYQAFLKNPPEGYEPHQDSTPDNRYDPLTDPESAEFQQRQALEAMQHQQNHTPGLN